MIVVDADEGNELVGVDHQVFRGGFGGGFAFRTQVNAVQRFAQLVGAYGFFQVVYGVELKGRNGKVRMVGGDDEGYIVQIAESVLKKIQRIFRPHFDVADDDVGLKIFQFVLHFDQCVDRVQNNGFRQQVDEFLQVRGID